MTKRKKNNNFELVGTVQITTTAERSKRQKWKTFKFWSIEASFQHRKNLLKHDQCKSHQDLFCTIFWPLDRQGWKGKLKERLNSDHLFEYFIQKFRTFRKKENISIWIFYPGDPRAQLRKKNHQKSHRAQAPIPPSSPGNISKLTRLPGNILKSS